MKEGNEKIIRIQLTNSISTTNTTNIQIMPLEDDIQQLNKNQESETWINYQLINYFFADACTQYPPCRVWWQVRKKQQRNNKTTTTTKNKNSNNKSIKPKQKKQTNSKIQQKTRISDRGITEEKNHSLVQSFADIAFNPRSGSCCNAQRYGNNDGG